MPIAKQPAISAKQTMPALAALWRPLYKAAAPADEVEETSLVAV